MSPPHSAPLAILGAMPEELQGVAQRLHQPRTEQVAGRTITCGTWHGRPVVLALSRIGKVAAATTATALIERFAVGQMLFTGVAGGLSPHVQVGDVVVARSFLQHDLDASPLFARHEVPLYGRARFDTDAAASDRLMHAAQQVLRTPAQWVGAQAVQAFGLHAPQVHLGLIVSGDVFVATTAQSQALQRELPDALAVDMEGASVAQVCHDYGVPFAAVRTISDRADDSAHTDFVRFVREVASRYSLALLDGFMAPTR